MRRQHSSYLQQLRDYIYIVIEQRTSSGKLQTGALSLELQDIDLPPDRSSLGYRSLIDSHSIQLEC